MHLFLLKGLLNEPRRAIASMRQELPRLDLALSVNKRLIEKIIPRKKIGVLAIKPANIRWMNREGKHFDEVNSFHVNCE